MNILPVVCPRKSVIALALLVAAGAAWAQSTGLAVNSRGFAEEGQVHVLWRVDLDTGTSERIGQTGFLDVEGLALSPDGTLYGADDESKTLVTINTASGFSSPVGGTTSNMGVPLAQPMDFGMTFTCDGTLLVSSDVERSLFSASLETGRLTRIGEAGSLGAPITGIAAFGDDIYGIGQGITGTDGNFSTDAPNLYRIDPETAAATRIGSLGPAVLPYANAGLAFDDQGRLWALTDRRENGVPDIASEVLRIDIETGLATKTADADLVGFESLAISAPAGCDGRGGSLDEAEPIPATSRFGQALLVLALLALAGFTITRRA
jgi:sugar lactone lactonase YvrE